MPVAHLVTQGPRQMETPSQHVLPQPSQQKPALDGLTLEIKYPSVEVTQVPSDIHLEVEKSSEGERERPLRQVTLRPTSGGKKEGICQRGRSRKTTTQLQGSRILDVGGCTGILLEHGLHLKASQTTYTWTPNFQSNSAFFSNCTEGPDTFLFRKHKKVSAAEKHLKTTNVNQILCFTDLKKSTEGGKKGRPRKFKRPHPTPRKALGCLADVLGSVVLLHHPLVPPFISAPFNWHKTARPRPRSCHPTNGMDDKQCPPYCTKE